MKTKPDFPYVSDGCSGGMSWAWRELRGRAPPWEGLCRKHDRVYWRGGSPAQRRAADWRLYYGMLARGLPVLALLMLISVRLGGHPLLPFSWRWGYGYHWPRGYTEET